MQWLCVLMCILLVSGCGIKQQVKRNFVIEHQEELIAKFADLPDAPFQAHVQNIAVDHEKHDQVQIFYTTSMTEQDVIHFYEQQMERLGWELIAQSTTQNYLLHFSKPIQLCSILVQPHHFDIYVCNKKSA